MKYASAIDVETMPHRIRALPVDPVRGFPIPFFVAYVEGKPEFRMADHDKFVRCVRERLCWVCGQKLGKFLTFVTGPLAGINRVHAEPPCHKDCAVFSAVNCPFLVRPQMQRRGHEEVEQMGDPLPGVALKDNPGVTLLYTTLRCDLFSDGSGMMFDLGEPIEVLWYAEGKPASRERIMIAAQDRRRLVMEESEKEGPEAIKEAVSLWERFLPLVPKE